MAGEVFKFGDVPFPCGIAPSSQINGGAGAEAQGIEFLRDESKSKKLNDFKQIVRADDKAEEASLGDFVPCFSRFSGFGQEKMVVEVPDNAYQKQSNPNVFQINGRLWKSL